MTFYIHLLAYQIKNVLAFAPGLWSFMVLGLFLTACGPEHSKETLQEIKEVAEQVEILDEPEAPKFVFPEGIQKLMLAYPDFIVGGTADSVIWQDGTTMQYDDGVPTISFDSLLDYPTLKDHFAFDYPKGELVSPPAKNQDPGRIRFEPFFKKMYGETPAAVKSKLVAIQWLPSVADHQTLYITKINGVNQQLQQISAELDGKPHLHKYLLNIGGTFNWRTIAGTDRLSSHSFGITIDINVKFANYWKWDFKNKGETDSITYKNNIPYEIVEVFEKHGFIWGGKWYHYDSMHFEYRPELLVDL